MSEKKTMCNTGMFRNRLTEVRPDRLTVSRDLAAQNEIG